MYLATIMKTLNDKPMLLIWAEHNDRKTHEDFIPGVDLEGAVIAVRFPRERMPKEGLEQAWLVNKTQEALKAMIKFNPIAPDRICIEEATYVIISDTQLAPAAT